MQAGGQGFDSPCLHHAHESELSARNLTIVVSVERLLPDLQSALHLENCIWKRKNKTKRRKRKSCITKY